jgi:8-oxo-dGTP pyrophosphatase MutT (NUDIX family)
LKDASEENPFRILSTRAIYENAWMKVQEHQVIRPKGDEGTYGIVQFKNRAVAVLPFEAGDIWLVGQYRVPLQRYSWEIPKGGVPPEESLVDGAKRELQEETGLIAQDIEKILELHLSVSMTDEYGVVYLARGLRQGKTSPDETELLKVQRVSLTAAYERVLKGEITDSLSVAAILRAELMRRNGLLET